MKTIIISALFLLFTTSSFSQNADNYFNSGLDKYNRGDYQNSIADFNKVIEIQPTNSVAWYNRALG